MAKGVMRSNKTRDGIAAILADNLGQVEEDVYEVKQEWEQQHSKFSEMEAAMEQAGLRRLNRPNLLSQDYWVSRLMPTSEVIYDTHNITYADISQGNITYTIEDSRITTGHAVLQLQSRIYAIVSPENVTVTFAAGVATVTVANRTRTEDEISTATQEVSTDIRIWLSTVATGKVPYGERSRWYATSRPYLNSVNNGQYPGDADGDSIGEIVVDLAAADQITEPDGEVYTTAIQYDVTANTAWGNADWMIFNNSYDGPRTYDANKTEPKDYGNIPELIPGKKYTLSCWARMVTGEKAWVSFAYGGKYGNSPYSETTYTDHGGIRSAPVEVTGTEWQRISWTFVFEGMTGNQYTYTNGTRTDEATGDTIDTITRTKNWTKRVQFGVHRKYTGVLQLCGFRLVEGNLWITDTYDDLDQGLTETKDRVTALETGAETTKNSILSNFAESDTATATANHAVGDLFVMGEKLYKATAAIATGETITPGTNCAETTTEGYFAPKSNPVFGGSVSLFRLSGSTVGSYSSAVGMMVEASSFASHAEGTTTHATANSSHAEGNDTTASGDYSHAEGYTTTASARDAHAEGSSTTASGINAHAEGSSTTASQINAHAEGSGTTASGASSHAEGVNTTASGNNAHAEGAYTIANHATQHVFGKYNVADPAMTDATTEGNYIEIVGNGRSTSERHNARTLDWNGNEALAGGLTLGKGTTDEATITAAQLKALLALLS